MGRIIFKHATLLWRQLIIYEMNASSNMCKTELIIKLVCDEFAYGWYSKIYSKGG
jgi:hypothetical protein